MLIIEDWQPKKRVGASVNAYLILKQEGKILLNLRRNTGYCDGIWSLIAGHVEHGESATEAMSREAYEEIGVRIDPLKLKVIHVMHRKTNWLNVDIFFECTSWEGSIVNKEPNKHERIDFFSLDSLPINIVDYNVKDLKATVEGVFLFRIWVNTMILKKEFYFIRHGQTDSSSHWKRNWNVYL